MIILEDLDVTDTIVQTAEDASYLIDCGGTAEASVEMTMKERVTANDISVGAELVFSDANDTIIRDKGSWLEMGFRAGMNITIGGTTTNDGTFAIVAVTDAKITVTAASLADQTTSTYTATALIPDTDWVAYEAIGAG
ncbi:MAG: hypothetical protein KJO69_08000, partial [Gammaproteobacteria bacterium]|nr:hypothetical protein [Gammaproteobacteria bacterium]